MINIANSLVPQPSVWDSLDTFKTGGFPVDYPLIVKRFYSPQDQVHNVLAAVIGSATKSLIISMFGEDDPALTDLVLKKAQDTNIFCQINLDKTQAAGKGESSLVAELKACPATRVAVGTSADGLINHLKMICVDGYITISGSTNWSCGAGGGAEGLGDGKKGQNNEISVHKDYVIAHEATTILTLEHEQMVAQMARVK